MNNLVYLIPLLAAFIGWSVSWGLIKILFQPEKPLIILGFKLQGIFPKYKQRIIKSLVASLGAEVFSLSELNTKISSPSSIEKVLPFVDGKVDHFLRVKLAEKMPMISMFIGEATMAELKSVFMEELQVLFPELMQQYSASILSDFSIAEMIEEKLNNIQTSQLEQTVKQLFATQTKIVILISTAFGFVVGLLQLLLVMLAR